MRTILVDLEAAVGADKDAVVVLVSAPDGAVSGTWLGGDLPVEAPVNDGELVSYVYSPSWTLVESYRVTPQLTELRATIALPESEGPCEMAAPMTLTFDVPVVANGNTFDLRLAGANFLPSGSVHTGLNEAEVRACVGTTSFDLVLVAKEFANTDPLAFARVDGIAYVPGGSVHLPLQLSSERALVDVLVEADPETSFGVIGSWANRSFGYNGYWVRTTTTQTVDASGSGSLSYGPFALGTGSAFVEVTVPPPYFSCELDWTWKAAPFDGSPLVARIGALAGFAPQADGNVALESVGEIGDVMVRTEDDYASDITSYWALHEDPVAPYPLPAKPIIPTDLVPNFKWPGPDAELRYIHEDETMVDGYAEYARMNPPHADGRARHRVPAGCF